MFTPCASVGLLTLLYQLNKCAVHRPSLECASSVVLSVLLCGILSVSFASFIFVLLSYPSVILLYLIGRKLSGVSR